MSRASLKERSTVRCRNDDSTFLIAHVCSRACDLQPSCVGKVHGELPRGPTRQGRQHHRLLCEPVRRRATAANRRQHGDLLNLEKINEVKKEVREALSGIGDIITFEICKDVVASVLRRHSISTDTIYLVLMRDGKGNATGELTPAWEIDL